MHEKLARIEDLREQAGISREKLIRAANVSSSHYRRLIKGECQPGNALLARLSLAVNRLRKPGEASNAGVQTIYRLCVLIVSVDEGADAAEVFSHDPGRRATFDPAWRRAAEIRRKALYMAHVICGIPQRQLASAASMTPPAVHLAMGAIEDLRDEVQDDPLLQLVETALGGV